LARIGDLGTAAGEAVSGLKTLACGEALVEFVSTDAGEKGLDVPESGGERGGDHGPMLTGRCRGGMGMRGVSIGGGPALVAGGGSAFWPLPCTGSHGLGRGMSRDERWRSAGSAGTVSVLGFLAGGGGVCVVGVVERCSNLERSDETGFCGEVSKDIFVMGRG
jgi:hypothetical protein